MFNRLKSDAKLVKKIRITKLFLVLMISKIFFILIFRLAEMYADTYAIPISYFAECVTSMEIYVCQRLPKHTTPVEVCIVLHIAMHCD